MSKVSVEEAVRNLKTLLEQVVAGEEVVMVERDKAVAHLVPASTELDKIYCSAELSDSTSTS